MKNTKEKILTNDFVVWAVAFICCALWGSAFPSIKIGYSLFCIDAADTATQILFAGLRFTLAGILAIIIFSAAEKKLLVPKKESIKDCFKLSMLQTVGQYVFFYVGLAHTTGVKASIMQSVSVFAVIITSCLIFKTETLTVNKCVGSVIGFSGVVLVNLAGSQGVLSFNVLGDGGILMAAIMYAMSSVMIKKYSVRENPVTLSAYQFVIGGIILMLIGVVLGGRITTASGEAIGILVYLGFVSAVAYSLWSILLKYNEASKVAVFGFINPVCGVILSAILLNEASSLNIYCIVALILVCLGIYIANKKA